MRINSLRAFGPFYYSKFLIRAHSLASVNFNCVLPGTINFSTDTFVTVQYEHLTPNRESIRTTVPLSDSRHDHKLKLHNVFHLCNLIFAPSSLQFAFDPVSRTITYFTSSAMDDVNIEDAKTPSTVFYTIGRTLFIDGAISWLLASGN